MSAPISPQPVRSLGPDFLPAYLSNGVVGLRVRDVPLRPGVATVSGLEGLHPEARIACVPEVPYPLAGDIQLDSMWLSDMWHRVSGVEQRYDFGTGELHTKFRIAFDGLHARVEVVTFCCRSSPSLVAQQTAIATDRACSLTVTAGVDPRFVPGQWLDRSTSAPGDDDGAIDGTMLWGTLGLLGRCGVAYWTECSASGDVERSSSDDAQSPLRTSYRLRARKGQRVVLRQVSSMVPDAMHRQPDRQATRLAALGRRVGFDSLRRANADAWRELWRGRIVLVGADRRWQSRADAAFFYLHTSTHPGSLSTHPFGLAQWKGYHYYYGHVMWDVESFLLPPLLLTNPDAALAMLDYRSRCLEAARENARLNGHRGAQFPWQSSPARGDESAPGLGEAAAYEHHVSLDVAKAFADYAHATGDQIFLSMRAWPILAATADWVTSRAIQTRRGWEIRDAMGIAERKQPADNPAFVNMAAAVALKEAIQCAERMECDVPPVWRAMAEGIVLPVNSSNVILDHDGYTRREEKASTPAALAGLFPLGYSIPQSIERATLRYYLDMADDYVGSPMLSALLGVWAAMLPDRALSSRLFEQGYGMFTSERFNNVHEYRVDKFPEQPVAGPFMANLGGFLTACLYGLTGIHLGPDDPTMWGRRRVVMPDLWQAVEVERVWVRGRSASLRAENGEERATIEFDKDGYLR